MDQVLARITSTTPLMMHNARLANPLDEYVQQMREITSKRTKTEEDHWKLAKLEFLGGGYFDSKIGPYVEGAALEATIRNGAKIQRKGTDVLRGVQVLEERVSLEYEGPRKAEQLWESKYYDMRMVSSQGSRGGAKVIRTRPYFSNWACTFTLVVDAHIISLDDLKFCVDQSGRLIGLLDGRPRFGKFQIEAWEIV